MLQSLAVVKSVSSDACQIFIQVGGPQRFSVAVPRHLGGRCPINRFAGTDDGHHMRFAGQQLIHGSRNGLLGKLGNIPGFNLRNHFFTDRADRSLMPGMAKSGRILSFGGTVAPFAAQYSISVFGTGGRNHLDVYGICVIQSAHIITLLSCVTPLATVNRVSLLLTRRRNRIQPTGVVMSQGKDKIPDMNHAAMGTSHGAVTVIGTGRLHDLCDLIHMMGQEGIVCLSALCANPVSIAAISHRNLLPIMGIFLLTIPKIALGAYPSGKAVGFT